MSPLVRYYIAMFGWMVFVPLTFLIDSYDDRFGRPLAWAALVLLIASTAYALFFARCPRCRWRIAAAGQPFVRSLPPRLCRRCGNDLSTTG
jgi:hypothetical protein